MISGSLSFEGLYLWLDLQIFLVPKSVWVASYCAGGCPMDRKLQSSEWYHTLFSSQTWGYLNILLVLEYFCQYVIILKYCCLGTDLMIPNQLDTVSTVIAVDFFLLPYSKRKKNSCGIFTITSYEISSCISAMGQVILALRKKMLFWIMILFLRYWLCYEELGSTNELV